ncbi:hypothetical protein [Pseudomonas lini]
MGIYRQDGKFFGVCRRDWTRYRKRFPEGSMWSVMKCLIAPWSRPIRFESESMTEQVPPQIPVAAALEVGQCVRVNMNSDFRAGCFGLVAETYPEFPEYVGLAFACHRQSLPVLAEIFKDDVEGWLLVDLDLSTVAWATQRFVLARQKKC